MNPPLFPISLSPSDAWLLDFMIQSTLVLSIALVANYLFHRRSAARRHMMLLVAIASLPLLLVSSVLVPGWQLFGSGDAAVAPGASGASGTSGAIEVKVEHSLVVGNPVAGEESLSAGAKAVSALSSEPSRLSLAFPLLAIWFAGFGFLLVKLAAGLISLRRLSGAGDSAELESLLAIESASMGVAKPPRLLRLDAMAMPMTWGLRRHVIGLPQGAETWPREKVRRVLRHELAHVARRDCASGWLASICLASLWFHPLAWLLKSALVRAREAACDDMALDGAPRDERDAYVCDLVDIIGAHQRSRRCPGMAIALAMGAGRKRTIKRRLVAILDENRDRRMASKKTLLLSTPFWGAMAVAIGTMAIGTVAAVPQAAGEKTEPPPASGEPIRKIYSLVKEQLNALLPREAQQDPFAKDPFGGAVPARPEPVDLETAAASARYELVSRFGIAIGASDQVEIEFESRYKMAVSAPPQVQRSIARVLDSLMGTTQVQLKLHVFEINDPEWLDARMGGAVDPSKGRMIEQAEFEKLRKDLSEKFGGTRALPSVVTRSGQRCKIEIIKEFIYPTEYDPPELPASAKGDPANKVRGTVAVTPANPTAFDVRNVGLTWEVEPLVMVDGSIELNTEIEDCRFEGFINYGSEINGIIKEKGEEKAVTLTDNRILQPLFRVERVNTNFVLPRGKLVALRTLAPRVDQHVQDVIQSEVEVEVFEQAGGGGGGGGVQSAPQPQPRLSHLYIIEAKVVEKGK